MILIIIVTGIVALTIFDYAIIREAGMRDDEEQEQWIKQWREEHARSKERRTKSKDTDV